MPGETSDWEPSIAHNQLAFGYDAGDGSTTTARYYDPQLGRFLSQDPIGLAGGVNGYAYAGGDPINRRDPSGTDYGCDASYWSFNQAQNRYADGSLGPPSDPYNWTYYPNTIACNNPDPGVPVLPGAQPGQGGGTRGASSRPNVVQQIDKIAANACVQASAAVLQTGAETLIAYLGGSEMRVAMLTTQAARRSLAPVASRATNVLSASYARTAMSATSAFNRALGAQAAAQIGRGVAVQAWGVETALSLVTNAGQMESPLDLAAALVPPLKLIEQLPKFRDQCLR